IHGGTPKWTSSRTAREDAESRRRNIPVSHAPEKPSPQARLRRYVVPVHKRCGGDLEGFLCMKTISFEVAADGIATVTIDVADRSMNVMTPGFLEDLSAAVDRLTDDDGIKGAVITSGKDSFMAGADLVELVGTF